MDENTNTTDVLLGVADAVVMDAPTPDDGNGKRNRRPVVVAVVSVAILALLAGCGWFGWRAYTGHRLAEARQACVEASESYRKAADSYSKLVDGDAAAASKVAAGQVADAKTVGALSKELKVTEPKAVACVADDMAGYESKTGLIGKNTGWYGKHAKSLKAAVKAVNDSKLAKTVSDAERLLKDSDGKVQDASTRDELSKAVKAKDAAGIAAASKKVNDSVTAKTKADEEAQRKAEEEAAAQAAAEAAAAAQAQTQQSYSTPQQSYTPSYSGGTSGSTGGGSGSSAPDFVPVSKGFGVGSADDCDAACRAPIQH